MLTLIASIMVPLAAVGYLTWLLLVLAIAIGVVLFVFHADIPPLLQRLLIAIVAVIFILWLLAVFGVINVSGSTGSGVTVHPTP